MGECSIAICRDMRHN